MGKELTVDNGEVQDASYADNCPECDGVVKRCYNHCPWCGEPL